MRKVGIRGKIVKAAIIAVGITMTIGTGVYASSSLWHPFVAERFGISSDMDAQKELVDDGFVSVPEETDKDALVSTVEDKGIKLELLQTVAGHERAQVYIQATFDEEYKIIDDEVNEIVGERLCTVLIDSSSDQTYILGLLSSSASTRPLSPLRTLVGPGAAWQGSGLTQQRRPRKRNFPTLSLVFASCVVH